MSCNLIGQLGGNSYYITGSKENKEHLTELYNLLEQEEEGSEGEFAVTREIAANFARLKDYDKLIHFLCERVNNNPADIYNGCLLFMTAYTYIQLDSNPIAAIYFDLILDNYPDLTINDESIHLLCLKHLIDLNNNPERQVRYYKELISRFPDKIDIGTSYFMLGQACEKIGDWNGAIQAYINYLPYTGTIISGFPNSDQYAKQQVDFNNSAKDWTFESLPALRRAIEEALDTNNTYMLRRIQAKVNFFAHSWEQRESDDSRIIDYIFDEFMFSNRIKYLPGLDPSSNATEAYLRTTGWSGYLDVWYFYFRKIYFPQDPEIHGRWEWAGIYYGEKF